ncbi:MAG: PspC domain-containing protein [Bacteroidales bacterium]|nr:PspC domain-containing protein [Bacteroidales bacterium]
MKKTLQVNIGGFAFSVDEESYEIIDKYLESIRSYYSVNAEGKEIVEDIEERMGELLAERCGLENVVTAADARYAIGILGSPAAIEGGEEAPAGAKAPRAPKRLYRNPEGKIIGGVCSGLAAYLHWDVSLIRLVILLAEIGLLIWGEVIFLLPLLYIVCWIAMPLADTVQKQCEMRGEQISAAGIGQQYAYAHSEESAPAGRTAGRVLGVILGIILFTSGLSALAGGAFFFSLPSLAGLIPEFSEAWAELTQEIDVAALSSLSISTWIVAAIVYAIPCIIAIYYGILLTFNLKSPKWRPGLILVIIWAVALVALAVLAGSTFIKLLAL